jgi:hypothetical protein
MPESRGSGTNAQVFAQAWAAGNGPVAVVLAAADYVLCVGAVVSRELYGVRCPVIVADAPNYASLTSGDIVAVRATEAEATLRIVQPTPRAGPPDTTPTTK